MAHPDDFWWITSGGSTFLPTQTTTKSSSSPHTGSSEPTTTTTSQPAGSGAPSSTLLFPSSSFTNSGSGIPSTSFASGSNSNAATATNSAGGVGVTTSSVPITLSYTITSSSPISFTTTMSGSGGDPATVTSTSYSESLIATQTTSFSIVNIGGISQPTGTPNASSNSRSICAGDGVDSMSIGAISTLIFGLVVGALIWLLFAVLRPRMRQLYGLREWFVRPDLRPQPLGNSLFAFLHPPVPLVPGVPTDVSDYGDSAAGDAHLFPSDDELSQRTIWTAFMMVLAFTFVGLVGALPLYMVDTPCTGNTAPDSTYQGQWSAMQDLSLLRVLQLLKQGDVSTNPGSSSSSISIEEGLRKRLTVDGKNWAPTARTRLLILTVIVLVVGVLPALHRLIKEFNSILAYHKRWVAVRCDGLEMGWLSVTRAPGLKGMGEADVKTLFETTGMSKRSSSETSGGRTGMGGGGDVSPSRRGAESPTTDAEDGALTRRGRYAAEAGSEIDVSGIFSIVDTHKLRKLIRARDVVLNNLEKAECLYIDSFRLTTPVSSIADDEMTVIPEEPAEITASDGRHISRPKPLRPSKHPRRNGSLSAAPTSYVAPSSYYRLRGVRGVSGGTSRGTGQYADDQSLSDEVGSRVVGSRFQEVTSNNGHNGQGAMPVAAGSPNDHEDSEVGYYYNPNTYSVSYPSRRPSVMFGALPRGERAASRDTGALLDLGEGPNHGEPDVTEEMSGLDEHDVDNWALVNQDHVPQILERSSFLSRLGLGLPPLTRSLRGHHYAQQQHRHASNVSQESFFSPDQPRASGSLSQSGSSSHGHHRDGSLTAVPGGRLRGASASGPGADPTSTHPHMRMQLQRPIVRPISGLHQDQLGTLYGEIRYWRTQLKALNLEVAEEQRSLYEDISQGINMRGWLLMGRGVRFIPGVRMIEGRSKDDIRWKDLQDESGRIGTLGFWIIVSVVCLLLAGVLIPILGLFMTDAPDFAHFVPALNPLVSTSSIGPAIATTLAPSLAAILFTCVALGVVHYSAQLSGAISNSQTRVTAFKATFFVLIVISGVWMIGLGAVLYSLQSLDTGSQETQTVAEGAVYTAAFVLILGLNMAFIAPGLMMLQPMRLWRVIRGQWKALTPRQNFRAIYPQAYNPSFGLGACIIAVFLTATLVVVFPLLGPPLCILVLLTLVAHRYLVGYVYSRTDRGQSGGLLHLWMMRRFGTMLGTQPFLLGLVLLPFKEWALACVLLGTAAGIVIFVEAYCGMKMRQPGVKSLSDSSRESLDEFSHELKNKHRDESTDEKMLPSRPDQEAAPRPRRTIASMASILDMMNHALAIPTSARSRAAIPLPSESINDLVSTERAVSTSPDAPPHLNAPDPADDVADLLYPPELLAPDPVIWLTNDPAGVGRSEAHDLERYHNLPAILSLSSTPRSDEGQQE